MPKKYHDHLKVSFKTWMYDHADASFDAYVSDENYKGSLVSGTNFRKAAQCARVIRRDQAQLPALQRNYKTMEREQWFHTLYTPMMAVPAIFSLGNLIAKAIVLIPSPAWTYKLMAAVVLGITATGSSIKGMMLVDIRRSLWGKIDSLKNDIKDNNRLLKNEKDKSRRESVSLKNKRLSALPPAIKFKMESNERHLKETGQRLSLLTDKEKATRRNVSQSFHRANRNAVVETNKYRKRTLVYALPEAQRHLFVGAINMFYAFKVDDLPPHLKPSDPTAPYIDLVNELMARTGLAGQPQAGDLRETVKRLNRAERLRRRIKTAQDRHSFDC